MANAGQLNGLESQPPIAAKDVLPGTTFAENDEKKATDIFLNEKPLSVAGPQINGRSTNLTLFSPPQLVESPLLPSLYKLINHAFAESHARSNNRLRRDRLRYDGQMNEELGNKPGTFTYVLCYSGTEEVIATASAKPHAQDLQFKNGEDTTWKRLVPIAEGKEAWELSTMAVDPTLQKQGLAGYLMKVTEDEVRRRFKAAAQPDKKELILVITTMKERNMEFYIRRGFELDYEIWYDKGHFGSETGFTIIFMSRTVAL